MKECFKIVQRNNCVVTCVLAVEFSTLFSAKITRSAVPGINLKDENPRSKIRSLLT